MLGWPSFYDALPNAVKLHKDLSHGMIRTEVTCAKVIDLIYCVRMAEVKWCGLKYSVLFCCTKSLLH